VLRAPGTPHRGDTFSRSAIADILIIPKKHEIILKKLKNTFYLE